MKTGRMERSALSVLVVLSAFGFLTFLSAKDSFHQVLFGDFGLLERFSVYYEGLLIRYHKAMSLIEIYVQFDRLLLGSGQGHYELRSGAKFLDIDSQIVRTLIESGIVGLGLWAIFITLLWKSFRAKPDLLSNTSTYARITIISFMSTALVYDVLIINSTLLFFIMFLFYSLSIVSKRRPLLS